MQQIAERILKECFWEYDLKAEDIIALAKSSNPKEQRFLFEKILANSTYLLKSMEIFDLSGLKKLIDEYRVSAFNHDYIARRINMLEFHFLGRALSVDELRWTA